MLTILFWMELDLRTIQSDFHVRVFNEMEINVHQRAKNEEL